jgi:hypothetical protein
MRRNWKMLNKVARNGKTVGGRERVEDWDAVQLIEEAVDKEPEKLGFESTREVIDFALGIGEHSDSKGFTYDMEDIQEIDKEGFFNEPHCPYCVEEAAEIDIDEQEINPQIEPYILEYTRQSFKQGSTQKEVTEIRYRCNQHPDFYIRRKEKEHR